MWEAVGAAERALGWESGARGLGRAPDSAADLLCELHNSLPLSGPEALPER